VTVRVGLIPGPGHRCFAQISTQSRTVHPARVPEQAFREFTSKMKPSTFCGRYKHGGVGLAQSANLRRWAQNSSSRGIRRLAYRGAPSATRAMSGLNSCARLPRRLAKPRGNPTGADRNLPAQYRIRPSHDLGGRFGILDRLSQALRYDSVLFDQLSCQVQRGEVGFGLQ